MDKTGIATKCAAIAKYEGLRASQVEELGAFVDDKRNSQERLGDEIGRTQGSVGYMKSRECFVATREDGSHYVIEIRRIPSEAGLKAGAGR